SKAIDVLCAYTTSFVPWLSSSVLVAHRRDTGLVWPVRRGMHPQESADPDHAARVPHAVRCHHANAARSRAWPRPLPWAASATASHRPPRGGVRVLPGSLLALLALCPPGGQNLCQPSYFFLEICIQWVTGNGRAWQGAAPCDKR